MDRYRNLLDSFVKQNRDILGDNLVGIYLHGSAVMGCFHDKMSDIDLLIVIQNDISDGTKRRYMDMIVGLNQQAPAKGLELSIIRRDVCSPFVYPTPFALHFSRTHLSRYRSDPEGYIATMKGTDKDLAAHATILYHRGQTLYGKEIREVFSEVDRADYFDSIWSDIENAKEEIADNPMYVTLNLCRVLAYKEDNLILSKSEGGEWGLEKISPRYRDLISDAIAEYQTGSPMRPDGLLAKEYAGYMLEQIKSK